MASETNEIVGISTSRNPRHLFIILNGKKADDEHLREAVKHLRSACVYTAYILLHIRFDQLHHLFREEGHDVDVRVTWESADAQRFVEEALALTTVSTLVAAGGDGTVNEVFCTWYDCLLPALYVLNTQPNTGTQMSQVQAATPYQNPSPCSHVCYKRYPPWQELCFSLC